MTDVDELKMKLEEIKRGKSADTETKQRQKFHKAYKVIKHSMKAIYKTERKKKITIQEGIQMLDRVLDDMLKKLRE